MPLKQAASLSQRQPVIVLVLVLVLQPFSTAHLTDIRLSAKGLVARMTALRKEITILDPWQERGSAIGRIVVLADLCCRQRELNDNRTPGPSTTIR
ncbi:hypothetical protein P175DRAFT_039152 [Aspergillus ochraceoroseus IBT 24754]|uniref:Uncharacterized protein n=1 Tax=Aspergillus ochraceoroseus IBT 24754 TaxID=1392256 RepID=A0A2T5M7K1_9EURO|nr:uncharacterized protein P175DRAFT_039152 [Aspergillus ochraceoroseus IBT 24754]PTU24521.1 hypothetical protein P175DRAFT_039152 [Aspergillus ochraceoroseus IBT 24754]